VLFLFFGLEMGGYILIFLSSVYFKIEKYPKEKISISEGLMRRFTILLHPGAGPARQAWSKIAVAGRMTSPAQHLF